MRCGYALTVLPRRLLPVENPVPVLSTDRQAAPDAVAPVRLPPAAVVAVGKHRLRVSLPPRCLVVLELRASNPPAV